MKIGDEVYVHGYVDEIRNGTIIIRNEGGYFGTAPDEVMPPAQPIQTASNYLQSLPTSPLLVGKMPSAQPEPQWIPCSERLPEDEYVLISKKPTKLSGSKWCVTIAIRMADPRSRKVDWRDIGFNVIQDNEVLAWMPLPEPYKEGGGEE